MKIDENRIKALTLEHMRVNRSINSKSVIASEFVLGNSGNRIDLAVWNGEFVGIEIKSKFDTLKRLPDQIQTYLNIFDKIIVVAAEKHLAAAYRILPPEVEVWSVNDFGHISVMKLATCASLPQLTSLADLIPLNPLKKLAGLTVTQKVSRQALHHSLATMNFEAIRNKAIQIFCNNFKTSSKDFWQETGRRKISVDALISLSRFREDREVWEVARREEAEFWDRWQLETMKLFAPVMSQNEVNHSIQLLPGMALAETADTYEYSF